MANTIRIKRSTGSSAPTSLANAEMAYSEGSNTLYIGVGTGGAGGSATSIVAVGGTGGFVSATTVRDANVVFAGPTTGTAAAPTFRALVAADIPTITAAKVSDFDTQVRTSRLDQMAAPTASVGLNSQKITGLGTPSSNTDAATKGYVDTAVSAVDVSSQLANYLPLTGGTISSNLTVTGNLTVNGSQTIINSTTLAVDDKNIVLGDVETPTDATADGGGITLKGATDKTFNWVDTTDAWTSSEHINLLTGKAYYINGSSVLSASTLGSGVTSSSLTSVGTIGTGVWQGTAVGVAYGGTGLTAALNGIVKGNGSAYSAAVAGTDYLSPSSEIDGGTY